MMYPNINPVLIQVGPFAVRWYGLMYVVGFLLGYFVLLKLSQREQYDLTKQEVGDLLYFCIAGLVVGARLGYCLIYNFSYYIHEPLKMFAVWEGGMSFHGGLAGAAVAGWIFARRRHKSLLMIADLGAVAAPLGLFFGRIGNFINGELYGRVTSMPWGMVFPGAGNLPRHPSQLYEAFFEGLVLFSILLWLSRKQRPPGFLMASFLTGYGVFRFFLEFFRDPDPQMRFVMGPFTMGQVLCSIMVAAGILLFWLCRRRG
ncbi:MAG: prolipoprotein diacylglyceryl transferase [Deltaproteobacteria bacterium]|nr:prolipoprotein diacylglyceryl transferase [Deltaproteobacteria bacterium]